MLLWGNKNYIKNTKEEQLYHQRIQLVRTRSTLRDRLILARQ